jgi:hypothetical protein
MLFRLIPTNCRQSSPPSYKNSNAKFTAKFPDKNDAERYGMDKQKGAYPASMMDIIRARHKR